MNRWEQAKVELEDALLGPGPRQLSLAVELEVLWARPRLTVPRPGIRLGRLPPAAGLAVDATTGWASAEVSSLAEAVRLVTRCGVRRLDFEVELDGERVSVGELLARGFEAHGEDGSWLRRWACTSAGPARASSARWRWTGRAARGSSAMALGPLRASCEGGERG